MGTGWAEGLLSVCTQFNLSETHHKETKDAGSCQRGWIETETQIKQTASMLRLTADPTVHMLRRSNKQTHSGETSSQRGVPASNTILFNM